MTNIKDVFLKVLNEYKAASETPLAGHQLAEHIRNRFNDVFEPLLPSQDRYIVKGSPGQGNWGKVPWIATFDTLVTTTAQSGYYITFLFKADMSGVYLNLNQGVTDVQARYKAKAREVLAIRASDFRAQLGSLVGSFNVGPIDLGEGLPATVELFNWGSICSKLYLLDQFPNDEDIISDYKKLLELYEYLVDNDNTSSDETESTNAEKAEQLFEDTRRKRKHDRIERNYKLARAAKEIHGYVCQVCSFDFEKVYGEVGKNFIEAHHLVPIASIVQQRIALDPKADFAVLCSNCHRMIHRLKGVKNLDELKNAISASKKSS